MTTTIENILGKDYTVVWHTDMRPIYELHLFKTLLGVNGERLIASAESESPFATALPALPRYPKNDEETIRLLHLYAAQKISIWMKGRYVNNGVHHTWMGQDGNLFCLHMDAYLRLPEITHATTNGERVEIAIRETE